MEMVGFVKKGGRFKSRNNIITKFVDAIAVSGFDNARFLKLGRGDDPFLRPTVVNHVVEQMMAQASRGGGPFLRRRRNFGEWRGFGDLVLANLKLGHCGREDLLPQKRSDILGLPLRKSQTSPRSDE